MAGLAAPVLLGACGGEYPQSSIAPVSDFAAVIHDLYVDIFWWTMLILAVVWIVLAYIIVRFRARPDTPTPRQIHGHLGMEIAWTIGPALIVVAIAIPTVQAVFRTQQGVSEDAMVVDVVGHQFWWEFRYPDHGVVTANELHLPVGRPVSLRLHSADVIHSFWIPQLGGKRDVNPLVARPEGQDVRYTWIHMTPAEVGTFLGQCAEFCGSAHSLMGMRAIVESPEDFEAWIRDFQTLGSAAEAAQAAAATDTGEIAVAEEAGAAADPTADEGPPPALTDTIAPLVTPPQTDADDPLVTQGREVFHNSTCIACHAIAGTNAQGVLGPSLTLLGRRATIAAGWLENTPENLARWIRAPRDIKPGVLMPGVNEPGGNWPATQLTDEQVAAVAAYLSSLR